MLYYSPMKSMLLSFIILFSSTMLLGIGVFFFGKKAHREPCGTVPHIKPNEDCPSQRAGLCPIEDESGIMKLANKGKISYN